MTAAGRARSVALVVLGLAVLGCRARGTAAARVETGGRVDLEASGRVSATAGAEVEADTSIKVVTDDEGGTRIDYKDEIKFERVGQSKLENPPFRI